jgi:hypothetical protein
METRDKAVTLSEPEVSMVEPELVRQARHLSSILCLTSSRGLLEATFEKGVHLMKHAFDRCGRAIPPPCLER